MKKETMTPRERWLAVLNRQKPDRVPTDIWATGEAMNKLMKHLGCNHEEMLQRLHIDQPVVVGPRYVGPQPSPDEDIFGVKYRTVPYGTGVYREAISAPLAAFNSADEIRDRYTFPSPDHWDYSNIPSDIAGREHRPIRGGGSEPFLRYKLLRGEEQAFMDLAENPDIVEYVLDQLFDLAYESTLRIFETIPGKVMLTYVAEDLGSQIGLLYSPEHIRAFLLPRMRRMMELTRQHGSYVITHSDGAVRDIIPDLIETGTQILNPVQWVCPGMEREGLKRDFGERLIFHGAMDNQRILPFGTVEDVRNEVEDNLSTLGRDGGYILAPCHNIQAVSPPENIVAMYEHAHAVGWF